MTDSLSTLFVRVAPELVELWEAEGGSPPVQIIGVERHDDGSLELTARTAPEVQQLREALRHIAVHGEHDQECERPPQDCARDALEGRFLWL